MRNTQSPIVVTGLSGQGKLVGQQRESEQRGFELLYRPVWHATTAVDKTCATVSRVLNITLLLDKSLGMSAIRELDLLVRGQIMVEMNDFQFIGWILSADFKQNADNQGRHTVASVILQIQETTP